MGYEYVWFQMIYLTQLGQLLSQIMIGSGHLGEKGIFNSIDCFL